MIYILKVNTSSVLLFDRFTLFLVCFVGVCAAAGVVVFAVSAVAFVVVTVLFGTLI